RRHFEIIVEGDHAVAIDLGSTNGTLLHGRKLTSANLSDGDVLLAGEAEIRYSERDAQRAHSPSPSSGWPSSSSSGSSSSESPECCAATSSVPDAAARPAEAALGPHPHRPPGRLPRPVPPQPRSPTPI